MYYVVPNLVIKGILDSIVLPLYVYSGGAPVGAAPRPHRDAMNDELLRRAGGSPPDLQALEQREAELRSELASLQAALADFRVSAPHCLQPASTIAN